MHDVAKAFGGVVDAALEKTLFQKRRGALLILLGGVGHDIGAGLGLAAAHGDEARIGNEEGTEAVPVARLAGGTGDDVVESGKYGVDRLHVGGIGLRPVGMRGDGAGTWTPRALAAAEWLPAVYPGSKAKQNRAVRIAGVRVMRGK